MAKKQRRRRSTRRRSKKGLSANFPLAKRGKRRSKRRSKKGFMSEMISHQGLKNAGMSSLSGGIGGLGSLAIDRFVGDKPGLRLISHLALALVVGAGFDKPNISAGVMGAYVKEAVGGALGLSEMDNTDYADPDAIDAYPDALDEDGNAMYLADDGNFYYLEEFDLAEDGNYYLAQTMQAELYPGYVNPQLQA